MNRILLVEDHERLALLVCTGLAGAGIAADVVDRIESAWSALQQVDYGALVLDRGLPDGDGLQLLQRLRGAGSPIPCLVLTARDALADRVEGLDSGADDYLPKPFAMEELVARVRALLRRQKDCDPLDAGHGDLRLLPKDGLLHCGERSVPLPASEMQLMLLLARKSGETVRRTALEAAAWGLTEAVTPGALDVAVHRLRRKLGAIGSRLRIVNVRGLGYALREDENKVAE